MSLLRILFGKAEIKLTCADTASFLSAIALEDIHLSLIRQSDEVTLYARVINADYLRLKHIAEKMGASVKVTSMFGLYLPIKRILKRPALLSGILLLLIAVMWLPSRVLFLRVEGNYAIPDRLILEKASICGISFGVSRREVRSEKMKNLLLAEIPQLEWAGINTYGCRAVISVKERPQENISQEQLGVSSIVAARDGIIRSCTATNGNALCKVGQAVKAGEVLISGYTDCGMMIRATKAEGEVRAETKHNVTIMVPTDYEQKNVPVKVCRKYSLLFGKKRINLYKGSGISDSTCDRMYSEYCVTLPGGFRLPLSVAIEKINVYDTEIVETSVEDCEMFAADYAEQYLTKRMVSGDILKRTLHTEQLDDAICLHGIYVCTEMIGRVQCEEIIGNYGKND